MSTERFQDRATSFQWQRSVAEDLLAGRGRTVAEYFDVGTRCRAWHRGQQASALLSAAAMPGRGFDVVVVGEYERAFCADQVMTVAASLARCGVQLWLPERTNPASEWAISKEIAHCALISEVAFRRAQNVRVRPAPRGAVTRTYLLVGLIQCGQCGRRMDSHWVHQRAGYRCRHGHRGIRPTGAERPATLYVREDRIIAAVADQIAVPGFGTNHPPAQRVAAYLRDMRIVLTCHRDRVRLVDDGYAVGRLLSEEGLAA